MTKTIYQIMFSPTGGTKCVSKFICAGIGGETFITELCAPNVDVSSLMINENDIVVISMPVFAGRVPILAVERLRMIESHGAHCVIVAVYGNRAYDDALLEMYDVANEMGFRVVAAVAAIAEHSIVRTYGAGRPDDADRIELVEFGRTIAEKIESCNYDIPSFIPGNRPYRAVGTGPFPEGDDNCSQCGECAAQCPVSAIPFDNLRAVDKTLCVSCMRCVSVCPIGARGIGSLMNMLAERLRPVCSKRKANELFL